MGRRTFGNIRKLPSGRWQASYIVEDTGQRMGAPRTFAAKSEASAWLATVEADRARGELFDQRLAQRTLREWSDEWLASLQVRPKTRIGYASSLRTHVLPRFGDRPVATITYRDGKRFVDELLAEGLAPGTVSEARKILRMVLDEAYKSDAIRRNPAVGLRVPRGRRTEMRFLSHDEVLALGEAISRPQPTKYRPVIELPSFGLLVRLTALTGLRAGEIGALRVGRVNPLLGRLEVAESATEIHGELIYGPPKTYELRAVPIPRSVADELEEHLSTRPGDPEAFVFTSPQGGPLRHATFYSRHYKPAVLRAGLDPRPRFHDLRHTAVALMIAEGAHLLAVKERLGHSTIQVTADRYGHLFPSLEDALTARLDDSYRAAQARRSATAPDRD